MDDRQRAATSSPEVYTCPGQSYSIDRGVHLARLAAFFPDCTRCEHRHDTGGLLSIQLRDWQRLERRASAGPQPGREGLEGTVGDIDATVVSRVAASLAASLWRRVQSHLAVPRVLVGTDGSGATAELVPAACRAMQLAGCHAVELGAVTSASLAAAAGHLRADSALWIGNSSGAPHAMHIMAWHEGGRPSSSPGQLDGVLSGFGSLPARPKRGGGQMQRFSAEELYLPQFAGLFHGLRPLVFVVDTACSTLIRYWNKLSVHSACRLIPLRAPTSHEWPDEAEASSRSRRADALACEVQTTGAHFGIWIDGAGEACQLVDDSGRRIDAEATLGLLANYVCRQRPSPAIVVESTGSAAVRRRLEHFGARVHSADNARQAMCEQMESTGAVLGGGPSGRCWFAGSPAAPDALMCLSLLVAILSESDRTLSEVLDAAPTAG